MPAAESYTLTEKMTATLSGETVEKKAVRGGKDSYLVRVFPPRDRVRAGGEFIDLGGKSFHWTGAPRRRPLNKGYVGRTVNTDPLELEIWMSYNPSS